MRILTLTLLTTFLAYVACGPQGKSGSGGSSMSNLFAPLPSNLRISLTDKPLDDAKSVNINVDRVEVLLDKGGQTGRYILASNVGMVDLLKLRNDVFQGLGDIRLKSGTTIREVRMILTEEGHHVLKNDSSLCGMKTPSAQHSGLKIKFDQPLTIESGYAYSLVLDFDAEKSVVVQGNGNCLLKPVIHVKYALKAKIPEPTPTPSPSPDSSPSASPEPSSSPFSGWVEGPTEPTGTTGSTSGDFTDTTGSETVFTQEQLML